MVKLFLLCYVMLWEEKTTKQMKKFQLPALFTLTFLPFVPIFATNTLRHKQIS